MIRNHQGLFYGIMTKHSRIKKQGTEIVLIWNLLIQALMKEAGKIAQQALKKKKTQTGSEERSIVNKKELKSGNNSEKGN